MKFWLGLAIGVTLGGGATYLGLKRPWLTPAAPVAVTVQVPLDGPPAPTPRKRGRRQATGSAGEAKPGGVDDTERVEVSAAQRAMEWRGDNVALPAARLDMASDNEHARSLEDNEIRSGIARGSSGVVVCIQKATGAANLASDVILEMLVDGNGRAAKIRVQAPVYLQEHGLLACVRRAAAGFGFPATGASTKVTAPFHVEPG